MKFPVSVIHVDGMIYLFQGEITKDFKRRIGVVEPYQRTSIQSVSEPQLNGFNMFLNGGHSLCNYRIVSIGYNEERFNRYLQTINHYKRAMGYDE